MKREILFRGKRTDNGEWIEGDLIQLDNEVCIADKTMWATEFSRGTVELQCCQVHPESVGQFTGLTDRNGKKIFEGDVLTCDEYLVVIQFIGGQFVGRNDNYSISETQNRNWLSWEIIGNIHDNPELLNTKP